MAISGFKTYVWHGAGNCVTPTGRVVVFDRNNHFTTDDVKLQEELDEIAKGQHLFEVADDAVVLSDGDNTDIKEGEQVVEHPEGLQSAGGVEQAPIHQEGMSASVKGTISSAALIAARLAAAKQK